VRRSSWLGVVQVHGELDMESVEELDDQVADVLGLEARAVVLDAAGLTFMDSSGIAILLRLAARFGSLEVRHASAVIRQIIEASGVEECLQVVEE
jgi:anti-anti-sigma factor